MKKPSILFIKYMTATLCTLFFGTVLWSQGQSIDNIALCSYELESGPIEIKYNNNKISDLSGVTYAGNNSLFMVTNNPTNIYETDLEGNVERKITLSGFDDTEGIVHIGGTRFAVSDEETKRIIFFDIDSDATSISSTGEYIQLPNSLGPWGIKENKSLEGVSYNPVTNTIYTVKEGGTDRDGEQITKGFYSFPLPTEFPDVLTTSEVNELCNTTINTLNDLAGMHHIGLTFSDNTSSLILSESSKKIIHIDENCNKIGEFSLSFMIQPEGVTMDNEGNIYVVGENENTNSNQFVILRRNPSLDIDGDGICDNVDSCPSLNNDFIGQACDDGDVCTTGETYDTSCNCTGGTFQDTDGDDVCDENDVCPNGDDNIDTDGDGTPDDCDDCDNDLIGTPCDDDNIYTSDDTYTTDCECVGVPTIPICRYNDSLTLVAFYSYLSEDGWYADEQWDFTQPMDTWFGISLNENGCVESIEMGDYDISGTIGTEIGDLTEIKKIDLGENKLSGTIPSSIGDLTNLEFLNLNNNELTGGIPASFKNLSNLKTLYLSANQLSGCYPSELNVLCNNLITSSNGSISNGNTFDVSWEYFCNNGNCEFLPPCRYNDSLALVAVYDALNGNTWQEHFQWDFAQPMDTWAGVRLSGEGCVDKLDLVERTSISSTIAPEIGDLSEITAINLSKNNISGGIPSEIGSLTNLISLNLDNNNIVGFPSTIGGLSNLKLLYLRHNNISGINPAVGNLVNLEGLYLDNNNIGGINPAIGNLTKLKYLYLNYNNIGGINPAIGNLTNLERLFLDHNNIGGIPAEIGTLTNLERLYLNDNNIGSIPSSIGNLTNLKILNLDQNNIGGFPSEIGNLTNLERLYIRHNNIGGIPSTIGQLAKLQLLYLSHNNITGINPAIGELTNLIGLYIDNNKITGINPAVGDLTSLQYLFLNNNKLAGVNPNVANLTNLNILYLNDNQISGRMPSWLGGMESLTKLKLNNNNMNGCFDSELSSLCGQLAVAIINPGNDFDIEWGDFCNGVTCVSSKIDQNQAIDSYNFPNPFSNQTTITYRLPKDSPVTLTVHNAVGKQVALLGQDEIKPAGTHTINFDGGAYPAGIYYYTIQAGAYSTTQKMILMK